MNNRGSSLCEFSAVFGILTAITAGWLIVTYLSFGRSWLSYQAEQALLCSAIKNPSDCRLQFLREGKSYLPWGELTLAEPEARSSFVQIQAQWRVAGLSLKFYRRMDLRSSVLSRSRL